MGVHGILPLTEGVLMRDWKGFCHRCGKPSSVHIMSMYNEQLICMVCKEAEKKRPDYHQAVEKDIAEYKARNPEAFGKKRVRFPWSVVPTTRQEEP